LLLACRSHTKKLTLKELKFSVQIDIDHPSLEGHFPGRPIVPGVVVLDEMANAFTKEMGRFCKIQAIPSVKFLLPMKPGDRIEFHFKVSDNLVWFAGESNTKIIISGQFEYSTT
jgi:3-hydroxyacyl-[acyl-carrier-protein] dehydratase